MELRNSQWVLRSYYKNLMYGFWTHAYHLNAQGNIILYELTEFVDRAYAVGKERYIFHACMAYSQGFTF